MHCNVIARKYPLRFNQTRVFFDSDSSEISVFLFKGEIFDSITSQGAVFLILIRTGMLHKPRKRRVQYAPRMHATIRLKSPKRVFRDEKKDENVC